MTTGTLTPPRRRRPRVHTPTAWRAGLSARLHSRSLDRDLGTGIAPWRSPAHAVRYGQLTSRQRRRDLTASLQRLLVDARRPISDYRLTAVVPPCRPSVLAAAPQLQAVILILQADGPVRAEGIVRLRTLLSNGAGPIYTSRRPEALAAALDRIAGCLTTQE